MNKGTILVIEDEENIASLLALYLKNEGFLVESAPDGETGLSKLEQTNARLVILDLMLPGIDGLEVCRKIRKKGDIPVIMLTARDTEMDKVIGLEVGADDYITKPFSPRELIARVKAVLRRLESKPLVEEEIVEIGKITVDVGRHEVLLKGNPVNLTAKEFDLLLLLARNRDIVLSREKILDKVWGYDYYGDTRTVDVHIRQIRSKLGKHCPIRTIWGVGYKVESSV